jgi:hypothetical protein
MKPIALLATAILTLSTASQTHALPPRQYALKGKVQTSDSHQVTLIIPGETEAAVRTLSLVERTRCYENGKRTTPVVLQAGQTVKLHYRVEPGRHAVTEVRWNK